MSGIEGFYRELFGCYRDKGFIEIRSLSQPDPVTKKREADPRFYQDVEQLIEELPYIYHENAKRNYCTYFGVLPRKVAAMARNVPIKSASVVWVDIDSKSAGSKQDILQLLQPGNELVPLPSYVIDSGNGLHAYWLLEDEVYDLDAIEAINKGLAFYTKGDNCHNRDRILRVPGSYNLKGVPRGTGLIRDRGIRYELDQFTKFYLKGLENRRESTEIVLDISPLPYDKIQRLPRFLYGLVVDGIHSEYARKYGGDRSSMDFYVACKLLEEEFSPGEVVAIFTEPGFGVSEKATEAGIRYLENTIKNAVRSVERSGVEVCGVL